MFDTTDLNKTVKRLYASYGDDWLDWLPETIRMAINSRWEGIDPIDIERILAVRNIIVYEHFWYDVDIFEATVHCFNWIEIDHRLGIRPSPAQIVLAVKIAKEVLGNSERVFSEDVNQYIAGVFIDRCIIYIPSKYMIAGAQKYLDKFFQDYELKKAVKMKYEMRLRGDEIPLLENVVDVQVAKLLAIDKFVELGGIESPHNKRNSLAKLVME